MNDNQQPDSRLHDRDMEIERLQRKITAGPRRKWFETDDPEIVECMGSAPECAKSGCQYKKIYAEAAELEKQLDELQEAITSNYPGPTLDHKALVALATQHASDSDLVDRYEERATRATDTLINLKHSLESLERVIAMLKGYTPEEG